MNTQKASHAMKKASATTITQAITRAEDSDMPETAYLPAIRDGTMQEMVLPRATLPLNLYKSVEGLPRKMNNFSECKVKEEVLSFR
jgi:hypothetical protein